MTLIMRRRLAMTIVAIALGTGGLSGVTQAQGISLPCEDFIKNPGGSWTPMRDVRVDGVGRKLTLRAGGELRPGAAILSVDYAALLDQQCPAVPITVPGAEPAPAPTPVLEAKVELSKYADAKGLIDVQKLTCGQLADTSQEDSYVLGALYIGWYNGLAKKNAINVTQIKDVIRNLVAHCNANRNHRITQAIDAIRKEERR